MERPTPRVRTGSPRPRRARPWPTRIGLAVLLLIAGLAPTRVYAITGTGSAPSTLLLHAGIPEALEFAAATARQRGWSILHTGPDSVTFEQSIDADATGAPALLRIEASFTESPAGVTVTLRAQEIQSSEGGATEARDVTQHYRENLLNALDSLASKWGLRPTAPGTAPPGPTETAPAPAPLPAATPPRAPIHAAPMPEVTPGPTLRTSIPIPPGPADRTNRRVGAWAYYAERYAEEHGCTLGDLGAVLEGTGDGAELHRVHCAGGRQVLVHCLAGVCTAAH